MAEESTCPGCMVLADAVGVFGWLLPGWLLLLLFPKELGVRSLRTSSLVPSWGRLLGAGKGV